MNYLLLGLGKSNNSIKVFLDKNEILYSIYDDYKYPIAVDMSNIKTIIKSPGISPKHRLLDKNKMIITDLELFYNYSKSKDLITVTGSNGKTTTVNLLKHLLPDLDLGGNIGFPLFDFIDSKNDIIIEASSFMLEYINKFRSKYSVILNLFKTHLEHHQTFTNYLKSKMNLIKNSLEDDYLIYNYDNILLRRLVDVFPGIKVPFSRMNKIGVYLDGKNVVYNNEIICNLNNIKLAGNHNTENILAAIAVVISYGRNISGIDSFYSIEFRLQYIGKYKGIEIYNDSKSTNFHALNSALNSFNNKDIILIVGGKNHRDNNYVFTKTCHIKRIYFYGENLLEMKALFKNENCEKYEYSCLEEIIKNINLNDVDILLFSPGSVSYDQYSSFEERGRIFNKLIEKYLKNIYLN